MKKIILFLLLSCNIVIAANATGRPGLKVNLAEPGATLQKMWIDYEAKEGSRYGMMMHISFTAYNMKGTKAYLGAYFKYTDDKAGSYIIHEGVRNNYHTATGILSVSMDITPTYNSSVYDDLELFMPYDEINLGAGTHELTIDLQLNDYNTLRGIAWLKLYNIEYTEYEKSRGPAGASKFTGKNHLPPASGPRAVYDSMWINYDAMENNQEGMMLHFKFTVYDMKDLEASVAVYFLQDNTAGTVLKDKNQKYTSSGGNVAVYKDIFPGYATTNYNDLQVFMPYDELDLGPGKHYLLMDVKLIYRKGGLISNFTYYGFRYTEPAR
ncbi:MAG: hypothetical protein ACT4OJ_08170 [Bacteroidota bacterium]